MSLEKKNAKTEPAPISGLEDILVNHVEISDWSVAPEKSMEFGLATTSSNTVKQSEKRSGGMPKSASFTGRSHMENYQTGTPGARNPSSSFESDKVSFNDPFFIFVENIGVDRTRKQIFEFFGGANCVKSLHMYKNDDESFTGSCIIALYDRDQFYRALAKDGECMPSQKILIYGIENGRNRRHRANDCQNMRQSSSSRKSSPGLPDNRRFPIAQSQDVRSDQINRKPTHTPSQYRTATLPRNFGNNVQNRAVDDKSRSSPWVIRRNVSSSLVSTAPANDSTSANAKQSDTPPSKPSKADIFGEAKPSDKTGQNFVEMEKRMQNEKKQVKKISKDNNRGKSEDRKLKDNGREKSEDRKPKDKDLETPEVAKPNEKNRGKSEDGKPKEKNQGKSEDGKQHSGGNKNRKKPGNGSNAKD